MATWLNADGLNIKFGPDEGKSLQEGGAYCTYGPTGLLEWDLDLTKLTEAEDIQNDVLIVPAGAMIEKVEVQTIVAAATGTAIDVGLIHISRNTADAEYTAVPQAILAAFAAATMSAVGEVTTFIGDAATDTTVPASVLTGGSALGSITVAPTLLTASNTTATAFTAGRVLLRVYLRPNALV